MRPTQLPFIQKFSFQANNPTKLRYLCPLAHGSHPTSPSWLLFFLSTSSTFSAYLGSQGLISMLVWTFTHEKLGLEEGAGGRKEQWTRFSMTWMGRGCCPERCPSSYVLHALRVWQISHPYQSLLRSFINAGSQATHSSPCEWEPALWVKPMISQVKQKPQNPQGIVCTLKLQSHWLRVMNLDFALDLNLNWLEWRGHALFDQHTFSLSKFSTSL